MRLYQSRRKWSLILNIIDTKKPRPHSCCSAEENTVIPKFTTFSFKAPTSLILNLLSRVILEIVDIGDTAKSSITIYVTTPFTNPPSAPDDTLCTTGGPTYCNSLNVFRPAPEDESSRANRGTAEEAIDQLSHRQRENVEEEIHAVFVGLRKQNPFGSGVYQQLQAY
ncbi:S-locus lectin protein kinase family protein [Striga asiatica]|uniref:S-locus lectin protein kinase family protein n=1 Tax=Striga asiatica TaxID=4170 RepID=A0A5A7QHL2_STRAF|nr:S-locus lectin protein kinase family protein [Striga asiatica]